MDDLVHTSYKSVVASSDEVVSHGQLRQAPVSKGGEKEVVGRREARLTSVARLIAENGRSSRARREMAENR
ncbi:hypothetical protein MRX96_056312 [Rhipicephalus microplus]